MGHSRKSLRQFLSSTSKAPTLPPSLPGSVFCLLLTKNKFVLVSAVFSRTRMLQKGRDYVWTEALGKVSECVTTETTFWGRRLIWFVTHVKSGRRKACGGLGLSLSGSTKCGGGRQREGLPGHSGYQRHLLYLGFPMAPDPKECKLPLLKGHSEEHSFII